MDNIIMHPKRRRKEAQPDVASTTNHDPPPVSTLFNFYRPYYLCWTPYEQKKLVSAGLAVASPYH